MSRLGLRLAVAFAFVVAAAVAFVTARSVRVLRASQEAALRAEAEDRLRAIRGEVEGEAARITGRLQPLASVRELRFRAQPGFFDLPGEGEIETGILPATAAGGRAAGGTAGPVDPVGLQRFVEEILPVTGLDSLEVTDFAGEVLARGQFPESFGGLRSDSILESARAGREGMGLRADPFPDAGHLSLVTAVPIWSEEGGEVGVVGTLAGGVRLDRLAARLAHLTGTEIEIRASGERVATPGFPAVGGGLGLLSGNNGEARGASQAWWGEALPLSVGGSTPAGIGPASVIRILLPATAIVQTSERLVGETIRDGTIASLLAAAAGILLALGPTRRLARLTRAAVRIGEGDLATPVEAGGRDEIGVLGETLARTAGALIEERERLARSERLAAWRDAARRLAHELKNAITPIGLSLQTVKRAFAKGPSGATAAEEALAAVGGEMEHLRALVEEFSNFARLPAPRKAPLDLAKSLRDAAALYSSSGTEIRIEIPADLPALEGDAELLARVWSNLLANAVEAAQPLRDESPAGAAGAKGWVKISVRPDPAGLFVEVTDSGPGLPAERVAGAGREGESTKPGGWGVGLALAERIVAEHGGEILFANALEGGARVRVFLPAAECAAGA